MSAEGRLAHDVAERQTAMFAMFVGPGLFTTRAALAAASGVPEATLRSYAGGAAMPVHNLLTLARVLPGQAINMLTEPGGKRLIGIETATTNWCGVAADAAELVAEVCEAQRDGIIDHQEDARLRRKARELIAELSDVTGEKD